MTVFQSKALKFIRNLPIEARVALDEGIERLHLKKGETLLSSSQHDNKIYYIDGGLLRQYVNEEEKELTVNFFFPNEIYFPFKSNTNSLSNNILETLIPTEVRYLTKQHYDHVKLTHPSLRTLENIVVEMALEESFNRIKSFQTLSATERYMLLMDKSPRIIHQIPLKYIASYLGINQASLSKIRANI